MSTPDPKCCVCGQSGRRFEFGPLRTQTIPEPDGMLSRWDLTQTARCFCDDHWPHGAATIMRIEGSS